MQEATPQRPERLRPARIGVDALLTVLVAPLLALSLFPAWSPSRWLSTRTPIAQAIAFPITLGVVVLVAGIIVAAFRCYLAGFVALVAALGLFVVPAPPLVTQSAQPGDAQLTVTTFNTLETFTAADVQTLIAEHDPDVIVLPEATHERVLAAVAGTAYAENVVSSSDSIGMVTTVIAHSRLGSLQPIDGPQTTLGTVTVRASDVDVTIVAVHTTPPLPWAIEPWRQDLERLGAYARSTQDFTVIAGDFNANLRHGPMADLGAFSDTARMCSRYPQGTWPADSRLGLRTQIDHVLVNRAVQVESCQTDRVGESDHFAYTTRFSY